MNYQELKLLIFNEEIEKYIYPVIKDYHWLLNTSMNKNSFEQSVFSIGYLLGKYLEKNKTRKLPSYFKIRTAKNKFFSFLTFKGKKLDFIIGQAQSEIFYRNYKDKEEIKKELINIKEISKNKETFTLFDNLLYFGIQKGKQEIRSKKREIFRINKMDNMRGLFNKVTRLFKTGKRYFYIQNLLLSEMRKLAKRNLIMEEIETFKKIVNICYKQNKKPFSAANDKKA